MTKVEAIQELVREGTQTRRNAMKKKNPPGSVAAKALVLIAVATRDRDEWREQHENLLAMFQTEQAARVRATKALMELKTFLGPAFDSRRDLMPIINRGLGTE